MIQMPFGRLGDSGGYWLFRGYSAWKWWLSLTLFLLMAAILITDFSDIGGLGGWGVPLEDQGLSDTQEYGVKAALLAMLTAGMLLVALFPSDDTRQAKRIDILSRIASAVMAMATGWFWLLNATEGDPRPYLVALIPMALTYSVVLAMYMALSYVQYVDSRPDSLHETQRWRTKLHWSVFLAALGVVLLGGVVVFLLIWLPPRIF